MQRGLLFRATLQHQKHAVHGQIGRRAAYVVLPACERMSVALEHGPLALIESVQPDVLVKGADYRKDQVVGAALVESYGGRVHLAALREGYSTTGILQKLGAA